MSKKRKNSNYKYSPITAVESKRKISPLTIFVCIFVAVVLVVGASIGIAIGVKNANAMVKYDGLTLDRELTSYFVTYYKSVYMGLLSSSGIEVRDTEEFWNTIYVGNATYGDYLQAYTKKYLRELLVANHLYDSYSSYTGEDRKTVNTAIEEILTYKANGDVKSFNSTASKFGFDFSTFKRAAVMLYKAHSAKEVIFGTDGAKMANYPDMCEDYLAAYSHVHLLFIRTENTFVLDEDGNRVQGDDGYDQVRDLTPEELADRQSAIDTISEAIAARGEGGDVQISPEMFATFQERYDEGDRDKHADGYYFSANSSYAREFSSKYKEVVDLALKMNADTYQMVKTDVGVCFIYKDTVDAGAYLTSDKDFFTDFYSDGASVLFDNMLVELSKDAIISEKYKDSFDLIKLPYNYDLIPTFEK